MPQPDCSLLRKGGFRATSVGPKTPLDLATYRRVLSPLLWSPFPTVCSKQVADPVPASATIWCGWMAVTTNLDVPLETLSEDKVSGLLLPRDALVSSPCKQVGPSDPGSHLTMVQPSFPSQIHLLGCCPPPLPTSLPPWTWGRNGEGGLRQSFSYLIHVQVLPLLLPAVCS